MLSKYIHEANADYRRIRRRVPFGSLRSVAEYHRAVDILDGIVDEIGEQETHPLADLAETLALAIAAYEDIHVPVRDASGSAVLRALMEEHGLSQSELSEIGSQGVVSEVLSGKRDPNVRQVTRLAAGFGVSPVVFLPTPIQTHQPSRRRKQALVRRK